MELVMKIKNIKGINEFDFSFPLDKGIYAITGENGSGKSTLISCASTVFYSMPMYEHFGRPKDAVMVLLEAGIMMVKNGNKRILIKR